MPVGVCNRWAKNATVGIDRGTADWVRDDARLAAPNTYGSFWDAANRGNPAHGRPAHGGHRERGVATTAAWAQRIGALRCTQGYSCMWRPIHSSVPNAVWVGAGMEERFASQVLKVLPVGKAACARRVAKAERSRPATSSPSSTLSTSAGSQRWALAVASTSGAIRRM